MSGLVSFYRGKGSTKIELLKREREREKSVLCFVFCFVFCWIGIANDRVFQKCFFFAAKAHCASRFFFFFLMNGRRGFSEVRRGGRRLDRSTRLDSTHARSLKPGTWDGMDGMDGMGPHFPLFRPARCRRCRCRAALLPAPVPAPRKSRDAINR